MLKSSRWLIPLLPRLLLIASLVPLSGYPSTTETGAFTMPTPAALIEARQQKKGSYEVRTQYRDDGEPRYTNRLIFQDSPYLLQHAHNPVNWYAWGKEAFAEAQRLNKPVFLSIGYSTSQPAILDNADRLYAAIEQRLRARGQAGKVGQAEIERAVQQLLAAQDKRHGGFRGAPKFPNESQLLLLLDQLEQQRCRPALPHQQPGLRFDSGHPGGLRCLSGRAAGTLRCDRRSAVAGAGARAAAAHGYLVLEHHRWWFLCQPATWRRPRSLSARC